MSKKIFIGIGAVLASALLSFGVIFLVQMNRPEVQEPANDSPSQFVIDTSKSYQACDLITESQVVTVLGVVAENIQPVKDLGIIGEQAVGEGVTSISADSQTCVYAFEPGGSEENGFNADNALTVVRTVYTNPEGTAPLIEQLGKDPTTSKIEIDGANGYFVSSTTASGPEAVTSHRLLVFTNSERVTLEIRQPSNKQQLSQAEAQTSLTSLARELSF